MGSRWSVTRWMAVGVQLLCIPGCSFWAVRGPNASVAGGGDCSTSVVAPVIDGVFAASFIGVGVAGAAAPSCSREPGATGCFLDFSGAEHAAGGGLIALGVLEAAAAAYGAAKVSACHEAKKQVAAVTSRPKAALALHPSSSGEAPELTPDVERPRQILPVLDVRRPGDDY